MFHQGDLQSGISLAISQQRTVACFIRDDGAESTMWEEQWLEQPQLSQSLKSKAILLKIQAGSQEAGFLAAFCHVEKTPSLVLIHNGQLKENVTAGVDHDDFVRRTLAALGEEVEEAQSISTSPSSITPGEQSSLSNGQSHVVSPSSQPSRSIDPSASSTSSTSESQNQVSDRQTQHPTSKRRQDLEKTGAVASKSQKEVDSSTASPKAARNDYLTQQKQRLAEAKQERERVMNLIEADKVARKQRERERKEAEQASMQQEGQLQPAQADMGRASRRGGTSTETNIQVRLFSGRTIRQIFPATATLHGEIRAWVDKAAAEDMEQTRPPPYVFKHVLNPLPSKTIEVAEEAQSLGDLDMLPSATLLLVPVQGMMANAFSATGANGLLGYAYSAVSSAMGVVSSTLGWVAATLGSIVGVGSGGASETSALPADNVQRQQRPPVDGTNERDDGRAKIRVRTLADRRADEAKDKPETWYNGNQTSYQPKDDPGEGPS